MNNTSNPYAQFHKRNQSIHNYPTEWVIRTMLGTYPGLLLDHSRYQGGSVLDLGFGDGRNFQLLYNCGLKLSGMEVTQETCVMVKQFLTARNIDADLRTGSNSSIPFNDESFDYILASSSCYYVDENDTFDDNLKEIYRCLKPGGQLVANFPYFSPDLSCVKESFILQSSEPVGDGHIIIHNDIYGLRNGSKFRAFKSCDELLATFSGMFENISVGSTLDDYFGVQVNCLILTCRKKVHRPS